jgi:DNA end-binding protein Ku
MASHRNARYRTKHATGPKRRASPMANRSLWSGNLTFGLVNIPVMLVTAVRDKTIHFHMVSKKGEQRLRRKLYAPDTGDEFKYEETARGYEIAPDQYVIISDEELEKLKPASTRRMEITEFVDIADVDPIFYEKTYYLAPAEGGAQAYSLLAQAMRDSGQTAIVRFVMRQRHYLAAIRPKGSAIVLHTMRYPDEVVPIGDLDLPKAADHPKKELSVAEQLIEALKTDFDPSQYRDEYRDRLEKLIEAKAAGKRVRLAPSKEPREPRVTDLMDALRKSLDRVQRPTENVRVVKTRRPRRKSA